MRIFAFLIFLLPFVANAQLWSEDFDGGNTTNPPMWSTPPCGDDNDYFAVVCESTGGCAIPVFAGFVYNNVTGQFFGARDMDSTPCGAAVTLNETLSYSGIDISSSPPATVLYVCFDVAESRNMDINGDGDFSDGFEWGASNMREDTWDGNSSLFVDASVDGAPFTRVTAIANFTENGSSSDKRPGIDVNCNGQGNDAGEPELTDTFTKYCFELPTSGSSLALNFEVNGLNGGGEDLAVDNIQVYSGSTPAVGTLLDACTPFQASNPNCNDMTLWLENFDGANTTNPFSFPPACDPTPSRDYLGIVCNNGDGCPNEINADYLYFGASGQYFGVRDMDAASCTLDETISATGIDISACAGPSKLYLCVDMAESQPNNGRELQGNGDEDTWDGNSSVQFSVSFDSCPFQPVTAVESSNGTETRPGIDTNCGDGSAGNANLLTDNFQTFCFELSQLGTSLDLNIRVIGLNTDGEDIAIDNIKIVCSDDPACTPVPATIACTVAGALTITCPANVTIECDEDTSPSNTGMATAPPACPTPTAITFADVSTQGMGCSAYSYTIIRTWTATDAAGAMEVCTQIITVEDNNPPTITCPANVTVECDQPTTPATTGMATATGDNCAPDAELTLVFADVSTQTPTGCGNDSYTITRTWTASDPCGNATNCVQVITIEDTTPPTIVCPADLTIECDASPLPANTGTAVAIDACAPAAELVIAFTDVSTQTPATCGANQFTITRTWTATDPCGNATNCVQVITVQDITPPSITCPANVSLACTDNTVPTSTGMATATDNCDAAAAIDISFTDISTESTVGCSQFTYTILRTWLATDACGNMTTCVQTIEVADTEPPVITCPPSQTLTCFETIPTPFMNAADFIAASGTISDNCTTALTDFTVFSQDNDNGGDNCPGNSRTLVRTYFVSDACGNTSTCTQTFTYLASTQGPVITSILPSCFKFCADLANPMESDITFETDCSFGATVNITGPVQIGQANCPGSIYRYTYTVTDDCGRTSAPVTRDFVIGNDGPTIQCAPFNLLLECGDTNNSAYIAAHIGTVTASTSCELGYTINHFPQNFNNITCNTATVVTFVATDACGRTATCTTTIDIMDSTAPEITSTYVDGICNEAICGSNVSFWYNAWKAKVLEGLSATDACDSNVSIIAVGPNSPAQDCPDGTAETVVTWVANDNCGNESEISYSFYVVPANEPAPQPSIMGAIATEATEAVENVTVTLNGSSIVTSMQTAANGLYGFNNLEEGQNYSVTPALDENPLNGVTSFDLVLISKHILQIQALGSPYKMIAADVNKSGSITTMDFVDLRKLILHIDDNFTNNTSWRFVEAAYVFPEANNPFATIFPEDVFINGLTADEQHDFVGVKIGDVNGSAVANALAGAENRNTVGDLVFQVEDRQLKTGETYDVAFRAENFHAIHGYQFSLNFDEAVLKLTNVTAGELSNLDESNFGLTLLDKGVVTTSWTNQEAQSLVRDANVFYVSFTAKADVLLSEAIAVSSRYTKAEAYNSNLELMDVEIRFIESQDITNELRLYQNTPNPFNQETVIGFELPESGTAALQIYDASGRMVQLVEGNFEKGYNSIPLTNDGWSSGLLYYKLVTPFGTATKKMILR